MISKKSVQNMKPYIPPLEKRAGKLRLDFNENTIGCSPKVIEAIKNIKNDELSVYPEYDDLNKAVSSHLNLKQDNFAVMNATDEAIMVAMQAFVDKADEIIIPEPSFTMFNFYANIAAANIINVFYNEDMSFPTDKILKKINEKTKLVVLVSPNNPTGTSVSKRNIIKIIEKNKDTIILLDEAYFEFSGNTCIDLIDKYDNLVILRTFSKAYGLAGLRLGCAISCKNIINILKKVRSPYSVNRIAAIAGKAALEDKKYVVDYVNEVMKSKKMFCKWMNKVGLKYYRSDANFVLVNFGKRNKEIVDKLAEKGILIRDRGDYPLLKDCTRITVGTINQMKRLINALGEIL